MPVVMLSRGEEKLTGSILHGRLELSERLRFEGVAYI